MESEIGQIKKSPSDCGSTESGSEPQSPQRQESASGMGMSTDQKLDVLLNAIGTMDSKFDSSRGAMEISMGVLGGELSEIKKQLGEFKNKFGEVEESLNARIDTVETELRGAVDSFRQMCDARAEDTKNALIEVDRRILASGNETKSLLMGELAGTAGNLRNEIAISNNEIKKINERLSNMELHSASGNVGSPMLQTPSVKPFSGESKYHAVDFLAACKDYFVHGMSDDSKIKFVKRFLEDSAQTWANQCSHQFVSYEIFEQLFLSRYWSPAKQSRIQNEFLNGPVYKAGRQSMREFCQDELRKLVHLDRPLGMLTEISTLRRRLPEDLQWELIHCPTDSLENFLDFIERMDHALCHKPHFGVNVQGHSQRNLQDNRNSRNWGNNQYEHNRNGNQNENWRERRGRYDENRNQRGLWRNEQRSGHENRGWRGETNEIGSHKQNLGN